MIFSYTDESTGGWKNHTFYFTSQLFLQRGDGTYISPEKIIERRYRINDEEDILPADMAKLRRWCIKNGSEIVRDECGDLHILPVA